MPYTTSQIRCLQGMGIVPWVSRADIQASASLALQDTREVVTLVDAIKQTEQSISVAEATATATTPVEVMPVKAAPRMPAAQEAASREAAPQEAATSPASVNAHLSPQSSSSEPIDFMQTPLLDIPFRGRQCTQLGKSDAPLLILVEAVGTTQNQYPFEPADAKIFEDMLRAIAWRRQDVCLAVLPPMHAPSLLEKTDGPCVRDVCQKPRDAVLLFRQSVPESLNADDLIVPLERAGMMAWQLPHPALLRESPARKRQAWNVLKAARVRLG